MARMSNSLHDLTLYEGQDLGRRSSIFQICYFHVENGVLFYSTIKIQMLADTDTSFNLFNISLKLFRMDSTKCSVNGWNINILN